MGYGRVDQSEQGRCRFDLPQAVSVDEFCPRKLAVKAEVIAAARGAVRASKSRYAYQGKSSFNLFRGAGGRGGGVDGAAGQALALARRVAGGGGRGRRAGADAEESA